MGTSILPEPEVIRALLEKGATQTEIAERYNVTKQAVSFHVRQRNLRPAPPRYAAYIPWRVKMAHQNDHRYHMLQAFARRAEGLDLTPARRKQLEQFEQKLERLGAVVDYNDEDGFYLTPRQPSDQGITKSVES